MALYAQGSPVVVTASGAFLANQRGWIAGVLLRGGTAATAMARIRDGQTATDPVIVPEIVAATDLTEGFVGFPIPFSNGFYVEATLPAGAELVVYVG